jgi:hypothetical protein
MFSHITIQDLKDSEINTAVDKASSYVLSYPSFIRYFENLSTLTKHDVIIGINFTYGWMPTIFHFKSSNIADTIPILINAKAGRRPSSEDLKTLKECFNNSLVGTSKLLHFINPHKFAIWDSRIYRYLKKKTPYNRQMEKIALYLDYLEFCDAMVDDPLYGEIHESLEQKVGYPMTKYRTIDLLMFHNGSRMGSLAPIS